MFRNAPFLYTSEKPYVTLDQMERETRDMEMEMEALQVVIGFRLLQ